MTPTPYQLGQAHGLLFKAAGEPTAVYSLKGTLYFTPKNWGLLSVPNALVRGAFDALHEIGAELPYKENGRLNAHISVIRPEELKSITDKGTLPEAGHQFRYTLGPVKEVSPDGWDGISKVWYISIRSLELEKLRKSYGLSPLPKNNEYEFHATFAVRRKHVLRENEVTKQSGEQVKDGPGHLISIEELNPSHPDYPRPTALASLVRAKGYSDARDYRAKHRVLAQLLRQSPGDFVIDQPHPAHPGLTHLPTGFRMHTPFSLAALATGRA